MRGEELLEQRLRAFGRAGGAARPVEEVLAASHRRLRRRSLTRTSVAVVALTGVGVVARVATAGSWSTAAAEPDPTVVASPPELLVGLAVEG